MNASPAVLVLDDLPDAAEAIGVWFEMEGWRAFCVSTASEARSLLSREEIAALVMEPHLREGSAMPVALAARRLPKAPKLVAVTWSARSGDHIAYEPTPFDINLTKPVSMSLLFELLTAS